LRREIAPEIEVSGESSGHSQGREMFLPFQILGLWVRSVLSVAILGGGIYLLKKWYDHREFVVPERQVVVPSPNDERPMDRTGEREVLRNRIVSWTFGWNRETAWLLGGGALVLWSLGGRSFSTMLMRRPGEDPPRSLRGSGEIRRITRGDGTELYVEMHGPVDGATIVLTHGWGLDVDEWIYAKKLAENHRVLFWDLPGFGQSKGPRTKDWSLEKLAGDLLEVVKLAGNRRVYLVGHSIGGMINLTFCKLFPNEVKERIGGIAVVHSTYTNPCRTVKWAGLYSAIQKPILEPLCWAMILLSPLFWLMNWMSYLNGSAHRSTSRTSFSGRETRNQLRFMTRYYLWAWPSVVARGFLGMFRYDATDVLRTIAAPALIIAAERDEMCTPAASEKMASEIPRARLHIIPSARHCGLFEFHRQFHTLIERFVEDSNSPKEPMSDEGSSISAEMMGKR